MQSYSSEEHASVSRQKVAANYYPQPEKKGNAGDVVPEAFPQDMSVAPEYRERARLRRWKAIQEAKDPAKAHNMYLMEVQRFASPPPVLAPAPIITHPRNNNKKKRDVIRAKLDRAKRLMSEQFIAGELTEFQQRRVCREFLRESNKRAKQDVQEDASSSIE